MAKLDYPGLTRFKGKIDTKFAGTVAAEYSASATYAVGDFVIYKNNLYKCKVAISTAEAWTPAHWDACTAGEELSVLNSAISKYVDYGYTRKISYTLELGRFTSQGVEDPSDYYCRCDDFFTSDANILVVRKLPSAMYIYRYLTDGTFDRVLYFPDNDTNTKILPTGYKYRFSFANSPMEQITNLNAYYAYINLLTTPSHVLKRLETAESDIVNLDTETNNLSDSFNVALQVSGTSDRNIKNLCTIQGGINNNGTNNDAGSIKSNYVRTPYIPVYKGDIIAYTLSKASTALNTISLYETDFTYYDGVAGTATRADGNITVSRDSYMRWCNENDTFSGAGCSIKKYVTALAEQNADDIDDIESKLQDVTGDVLPSYWKTYMDSRIVAIREKDALIGNHGDSFIFVTDTHIPRNMMNSPKVCKFIYKNSAVQKMVHGGDVLDINTGADGKAEAMELLQKWQTAVYELNELEVTGNHDLNNFNGENASNALTISEWYGIMMRHVEKECDTGGKTYYVFDNESQKIRYIILDCEMASYSESLTFMTAKLTELESGWTALVIQHRYWLQAGTVDTKGTQLQNAINAIYGNLNCTFAGVIVGHLHTDTDTVDSTNGYPIIGTNCDTRSGSDSGYTRTAGTKNEQSFDVVHIDTLARKIYMTRIGAGDDVVGGGTGVRTYSY